MNKSEKDIAEWRKFRRAKGTVLASAAATTLNLRPFWDGTHWELTLSIKSDNPQESQGIVAHFTPTL